MGTCYLVKWCQAKDFPILSHPHNLQSLLPYPQFIRAMLFLYPKVLPIRPRPSSLEFAMTTWRCTDPMMDAARLQGSHAEFKELSHKVSLWGPIKQYKWVLCKRIFNSSLQVLVMKRMHAGNVRQSIKSQCCRIYHPRITLLHHSTWIMNAFYIHICVQNPFAQ